MVPLLLQAISAGAAEAPAEPQWTDITSAASAVAAALFALVALVLAKKSLSYAKAQVQGAADQLRQARDLAEEQARPYVVIYTRTRDEVSPHLVDLVIENLGATGARDVTLTGTPPLTRSDPGGSRGDGGQAVALPSAIPFLAPGQRWQTFWDSGLARKDSGLPDRFEVTISYRDSRAKQHSELFVLDWSALIGRMWPTEKTVHHAAMALAEVAGTLKTWVERDEVVRVATYDGEDLDRRQAKEARSRRTKREALHRQLLSPATLSDPTSPSPIPASAAPAPSAPPSPSGPHREGEEGEQP